MKSIFFMLLTFLVSCSSASKHFEKKSISYLDVQKIEISKTTEQEVIAKFGEPFLKRENEKNSYSLLFRDPTTKYHRLSVLFSSDNKIVKSILWIPMSGEKEQILDGAKAHFTNSNFDKINAEVEYHHVWPTEGLLVDKQNGVTIRYKLKSNSVESIVLSEKDSRTPAESVKK